MSEWDAFPVADDAMPAPAAGWDAFPPAAAAGALTTDNVVRSIARGVPVVQAGLNEVNAKTNAALAPLIDPLLPDSFEKLPEQTFNERYEHAKRIQENKDQAFDAEHPVISTAAKVAGGVGAGGGLLKAAPVIGSKILGIGGETLAGQVARGAVSGAGISAADAIASGEDPARAASIGLGIGAIAPAAARAAGGVVSGIRNARQPAPVPTNTVDIAGVPVRRSLGQVTGDMDTIMTEQGALRNTSGQREQQVAEDFFAGQNAELAKASEAIAAKMNPGGEIVARSPQEAAEITSGAVNKLADKMKADYKGKYEQFAGAEGEFHPGTFDNLTNSIRQRLETAKEPIILDEASAASLPNANRALGYLDKVVADGGAFTPDKVDRIGKGLVSIYKDAKANPADRRAVAGVMKQFDAHLTDAMDVGLFSGDTAAIQTWRDARQAFAKYQGMFAPRRPGDDVGRAMQKIVGVDGQQATPTEIANYLYGSANVGGTGLSVRLGQRLKSTLGADTPEWSAVKQGLWSRMTESAEGRTDWGPQKVSERIAEFLNGSGKPLAQVMFSEPERALISEYQKLLKQIVPKPGTVNYSNTAATLGKMMRGSIDGIFAVGGMHLGGPAGALAGYAAHQGQKAIQDVVKASRVARSLYGTPSAGQAQERLKEALQKLVAVTSRGTTVPATH